MIKTLLPAVAVGILIFGCTAKQAEPIDFANTCKLENEKKYVEIAGYIIDQGVVSCSSTGGRMECGFTLTEEPGSSNALRIGIAQGSGANSVEEIKGSYKREDIKIHDSSGNPVRINDKVKLTGTMNVMPDSSFCFLTVEKIEK